MNEYDPQITEVLKRIDALAASLAELNTALTRMQHPERSIFGPAEPVTMGQLQEQRYNPQPFPYAGSQPPAAE